MALSLRQFQRDGVSFLLKKRRAVLADEMGLGKTAQTIFTCRSIPLSADEVTVIIAPKTLGRVWKNEFIKWNPLAKVEILTGSRMDKCAKLLMSSDTKYFITTYESLDSLMDVLLTKKIKTFVFDEAHKLKNRDAKMHKAASKLQKAFPKSYCFLLTGTPIMNRAEEMWSILHMMDPEQYSSFHQWANRHLKTDTSYIPNKGWITQYNVPRDPEAFREYASQYILRRLKKDNIDLPDKTFVTHDVELEGDQLKHYESMRDAYYMEWQSAEGIGQQVTATAIIAAITRMKQLALSVDLIRDRDTLDWQHKPLHGAKIEALEELVDEAVSSGQKVVVFSQFAQATIRLANQFKALGYKTEVMTGDNTDNQRNDAIERFQDGDAQVFFVGTQVGGVGITLTSASVAIFLDLMWTPAMNAQAADRLHRIGQKNPVTIYYIKAVDTIEDYILSILSKKEELFELVMPADSPSMKQQLEGNWRSLLGKQ